MRGSVARGARAVPWKGAAFQPCSAPVAGTRARNLVAALLPPSLPP